MMYVAGHSIVASSRLSGCLPASFLGANDLFQATCSYCATVLEMLQVSNNYWLF